MIVFQQETLINIITGIQEENILKSVNWHFCCLFVKYSFTNKKTFICKQIHQFFCVLCCECSWFINGVTGFKAMPGYVFPLILFFSNSFSHDLPNSEYTVSQ